VKLYDALREECILAGVDLSDKAEALREVVRCAKQSPVLSEVDEQAMLRGLEEREALGSTGFGKGIAIPHCRLEGVSDFVVGILTVPSGVSFHALDGKAVRLIVFIVAPAESSNEHIRLLSAVSQALHRPGAVQEIIAGTTAEAVRESFLRHSQEELEIEARAGKRLMHVFVQDEDLFHEILQVFAGMETSSVVVVTSENLRAYLAKVPLFQGLWSHEPGGFSHVIIAAVDKGLTNEMVRGIETLAGNLGRRSGVMVTVQEIFYSAGSLAT